MELPSVLEPCNIHWVEFVEIMQNTLLLLFISVNHFLSFFFPEEIDYVKVLNRALPKDIRVIAWCPAPPDFHARFLYPSPFFYPISGAWASTDMHKCVLCKIFSCFSCFVK